MSRSVVCENVDFSHGSRIDEISDELDSRFEKPVAFNDDDIVNEELLRRFLAFSQLYQITDREFTHWHIFDVDDQVYRLHFAWNHAVVDRVEEEIVGQV